MEKTKIKSINAVPVSQMQRLADILAALEDMNLSGKEKSFVKWLSGCELDYIYSFISLIEKARAE